MTKPAPYPTDIVCKGWRFELDHESIDQSDTWSLAVAAGPEARPLLLMLWLMSWRQKPCGSLPADEVVIAALIGATPKLWSKYRLVLMRRWWLADDGRLYHPTLTKRVFEMMKTRRSDADRQAARRTQKSAEPPNRSDGIAPESRVTTTEVRRDSRTGTGTGTRTNTGYVDVLPPTSGGCAQEPDTLGQQPTAAGLVCSALRQTGIANCNPGHPRLLELLQAGATTDEFLGFAAQAIGKGAGFPWILAAVAGERQRAAVRSPVLYRGPMPTRTTTAAEQRAIDAVPGIAAGRQPAVIPHTTMEIFDVTARKLG